MTTKYFLLLIFLFVTARCFSQAGKLDSTFGTNGIVSDKLGLFYSESDLAIQADGKILVFGTASSLSAGGDASATLIRYNSNGTIDNSFDGGGVSVAGNKDISSAILVQIDNDIVAGSANAIYPYAEITRLDPSGSLDETFAKDGKLSTPFDGIASSFAQQKDGKIVAGLSNFGAHKLDLRVFRISVDGKIDSTFGINGITSTVEDTFATDTLSFSTSITIDTTGSIIVGGGSGTYSSNYFTAARFDSNGLLDTIFGNHGILVLPDYSAIVKVATQADNKILALTSDKLIRLNSNGSIDSSYGVNGVVSLPISASSFVRQPDQKLVVAGSLPASFALLRYSNEGTIDSSFGDLGQVVTFFDSLSCGASSVALQPDGKIIASGSVIRGLKA